MPQASLVSDRVILKALQAFADDPLTAPKLWWWLLHRNATERWFQFELAYFLHNSLSVPGHHAVCERGRRDIDIVTEGNHKSPVAALELKWWGNWHLGTKKDLEDQAKDLDKIDGLPHDAIALSAWLIVTPPPALPNGSYARLMRKAERNGREVVINHVNTTPTWGGRFHLAGEIAIGATKGPSTSPIGGLAMLVFIACNQHHNVATSTNAG